MKAIYKIGQMDEESDMFIEMDERDYGTYAEAYKYLQDDDVVAIIINEQVPVIIYGEDAWINSNWLGDMNGYCNIRRDNDKQRVET